MTPQEQFWNWFIQHEPELFQSGSKHEAAMEILFDELASEPQKIDPQLTFEFGPHAAEREFVVSAGGVKRVFPVVISLVKMAPALDRWKVTAFRPRRPSSIVEFRAKRVDPSYVQFSLLDNGKIAGIYLFIPGFRESDADFKQIGYLLLDDALGEYDVATRLGLIKMFPSKTPVKGERRPLTDLPGRFDELISRLGGRSRKPS